jgi:hypothetical protein
LVQKNDLCQQKFWHSKTFIIKRCRLEFDAGKIFLAAAMFHYDKGSANSVNRINSGNSPALLVNVR